MNDPNGFSSYHGKIHLFYQFHPYNEAWGPMHWGHSETTDFVKWTELPIALAPDQSYDDAGCFSGSAIETEKGHLLVYTGVTEQEENGVKNVYQNQCLAIGNGKTYTKLAKSGCNRRYDAGTFQPGTFPGSEDLERGRWLLYGCWK